MKRPGTNVLSSKTPWYTRIVKAIVNLGCAGDEERAHTRLSIIRTTNRPLLENNREMLGEIDFWAPGTFGRRGAGARPRKAVVRRTPPAVSDTPGRVLDTAERVLDTPSLELDTPDLSETQPARRTPHNGASIPQCVCTRMFDCTMALNPGCFRFTTRFYQLVLL